MKKRFAQISMEYIILTGVVLMAIIPGLYLFKNYVSSSSDRIVEQKVNQIATKMINTAEEMYYRGVPSKKVIKVNMPEEVVNLAVYYNNTDNGDEYYLIFVIDTSTGRLNYQFPVDTPILPYHDLYWECREGANLIFSNLGYDIITIGLPNCEKIDFGKSFPYSNVLDTVSDTVSFDGKCKCFPPQDHSSGKKYFKIEAVNNDHQDYDCYGDSDICVIIDEISNEMSCPN